jgi:hypothetical protein
MWSDLEAIKGKKIKNIVVSALPEQKNQVFLILENGDYMEIYGERMNCTHGLSSGGVDAAEEYAIKCGDNYPNII